MSVVTSSYALCRLGSAFPERRVVLVSSADDPRSLALHPLVSLSLPCGDVLDDWVLCDGSPSSAFYEVYRVDCPHPISLGSRVGALTLSPSAFVVAQDFLCSGLLDLSTDPDFSQDILLDPPIAPLMSEGFDPELAASWRIDALVSDPSVQADLVALLSSDSNEEDFPLSSFIDSDPDSFHYAASIDDDPLLDPPSPVDLGDPDLSDVLDVLGDLDLQDFSDVSDSSGHSSF